MQKNSLGLFIAAISCFFLVGCSGNTDWEPVAEKVLAKYDQRLEILQSVQTKDDAGLHLSKIEKWYQEYEDLNDELKATMLRLRDSGGSLDYGKFDEFKKRWAKIDEPMTEELKRLSRMNGVGPDYDKQLGEFNRVLFYNPFR